MKDIKELVEFLQISRTQFINSSNETKFEDTKEYYKGIADGMLNVLEFLKDNKFI